MRKATMKLGRLVIIDIEGGKYAGSFKPMMRDDERYNHVAGMEEDTEGRLIHMFYQPCDAETIAKNFKDDPIFEEQVHLEVFSLDGKEIKDKLYAFDGTLYDALLIAANEGKQYDV